MARAVVTDPISELPELPGAERPSRDGRLSAGVFVTSLAVLLIRFLVPRPIGASDNGDGWRLLCHVGAYDLGHPQTSYFVRFFYRLSPPANCADIDYPTSQGWLAKISQLAGRLVGQPPGFSLVALGVVGCVVGAAGIGMVMLGLRLPTLPRIAVGILLLLVLADSAFFGWLASVDTEGAAFLGLVWTVGGLLLLHRDGFRRYVGVVATVVGGLLALNAKPQTALLLPLYCLALLFVRRSGRTRLRRWAPTALVFAAVAGGTLAIQLPAPTLLGNDTRQINAYDVVFSGILDGRHDARADLAALGLPASFARYRASYYWGPNSALGDPQWQRYAGQFTATNLATYYWHHPGRAMGILNTAAVDLLTLRPDYTGSFSQDAGFPPKAQERRVPVVSWLVRSTARGGLLALAPLWLLILAAGIRAFRRDRRELGLAILLLLVCAVIEFTLGGLGEGIEGTKHQLVPAFATILAAVLGIAALLPARYPADSCLGGFGKDQNSAAGVTLACGDRAAVQ